MKFECEKFSCFSSERETLFFGGDTVLRIQSVMQWIGDALMDYGLFMEPINAFSRMMNGLSVKQQPIATKKQSQRAMKLVIKDILRALVLQQHNAETPQYVRDLVLFHHASTPLIRLIYDELMTEYKWLDGIVKVDGGNNGNVNILDIANIAVLFGHAEDITFVMAEDAVLKQNECDALIEGLRAMSKMNLLMNVRFLWPSEV